MKLALDLDDMQLQEPMGLAENLPDDDTHSSDSAVIACDEEGSPKIW